MTDNAKEIIETTETQSVSVSEHLEKSAPPKNLTEKISEYENLQSEIRDLATPDIETFENQYKDKEYTVKLKCGNGELTSVCPKTGLPDFATLSIEYRPAAHCIELKSFKEYLLFYRTVGIFHENLTNKIAEDLWDAVQPNYLKVGLDMNPRGNIETYVEIELGMKQSSENPVIENPIKINISESIAKDMNLKEVFSKAKETSILKTHDPDANPIG